MHRSPVWFLVGVVVLLGTACSSGPEGGGEASLLRGADPNSWSVPEQVRVTSLELDLNVDFAAQSLVGEATWSLDRTDPEAPLWLDVHQMLIEQVVDTANSEPLHWQESAEAPFTGHALRIDLLPDTERITVRYRTQPEAGALQWLAPEQTTDGVAPFLLTQSQSIYARTWVPCQDTPGVRFTYEATVHTSPELLALMSAENPTELSADGVYRFSMSQPIPSYLLALAVGRIEFLSIGDRTGVYAEPSVVEAAAWEFAEVDEMMSAVESLFGPYRWGRYDMIVLPSSFPFGGMENPRLTFLTPTVLAGDRSLVDLVAHELAHSWSGNLVTNSSWNDFWLNEGFTDYVEHRITEVVRGTQQAESLAALSRRGLERLLDELGRDSADSHLKLDLAHRDPEEGMTTVCYVKGNLFLRTLEETVGREAWDPFLRSWFDEHAFRSMTTEDFLTYLDERLTVNHPELNEVDIEGWVYGPGLPADAPQPNAEGLARVEAERDAWLGGTAAASLDVADWATTEWRYFLDLLEDPIDLERMVELEEAFHFSETGNSEILMSWLEHAVKAGYQPAMPRLRRFLTEQGRLKFLRPLYSALLETESGAAWAHEVYDEARAGYHPYSSSAIDAVFKKKESE
jgi:aminopeptidase N